MFGIFKKKAPPAPSLELSEDELELIHCGGQRSEVAARTAVVSQGCGFGPGDAVVAVVGGAGQRSSSPA